MQVLSVVVNVSNVKVGAGACVMIHASPQTKNQLARADCSLCCTVVVVVFQTSGLVIQTIPWETGATVMWK